VEMADRGRDGVAAPVMNMQVEEKILAERT